MEARLVKIQSPALEKAVQRTYHLSAGTRLKQHDTVMREPGLDQPVVETCKTRRRENSWAASILPGGLVKTGEPSENLPGFLGCTGDIESACPVICFVKPLSTPDLLAGIG